jgi:hypothetical protein
LTRSFFGQKLLFTKAPFWAIFGQFGRFFSPNVWSHWLHHIGFSVRRGRRRFVRPIRVRAPLAEQARHHRGPQLPSTTYNIQHTTYVQHTYNIHTYNIQHVQQHTTYIQQHTTHIPTTYNMCNNIQHTYNNYQVQHTTPSLSNDQNAARSRSYDF